MPVENKKELAKRLAQCLNPNVDQTHEQALRVYILVFDVELALHDAATGSTPDEKTPAVFGPDMGLFISTLFNFYQFAKFAVKKVFLDFVLTKLLRFEKELVMSLSGFMIFIIPALDDNAQELV